MKHIGLWGPTYVPGRITHIIPDEESPFGWKTEEQSMELTSAKVPISDIHNGIEAAITVTNQNLINIQARIDRNGSKTHNARRQLILQSEANSIFKGNLIRMLKIQWNDSVIINRLKASLEFILTLGTIEGYPYICNVECKWYSRREYVPAWEMNAKNIIMEAFSIKKPADYTILAQTAIKEHKALPALDVTVNEIKDINFDSIKNIKF